MRNDLDELKENEQQLDHLIEKIKTIGRQQSESKQAYVTCQDLHNIDMYTDQVIMVVKAPPESQLILMDGDPPPVVFKSEKDEIDIFFCPDPSGSGGGLQHALSTIETTDSDDDEPTTSRHHRKASSASANKRKSLGSAQRNLSKAFEEMIPKSSGRSKSNLFGAFNATVTREPSDDEEFNTNEDTEDEDELTSPKAFKSTTITTKDLMLLNEPADELEPTFGIKKDVKLSLFSPQKNLSTWTELPDAMPNFSPSYAFAHSDDPAASFYPLEPDAGYNFLLSDNEGIMDLFDY